VREKFDLWKRKERVRSRIPKEKKAGKLPCTSGRKRIPFLCQGSLAVKREGRKTSLLPKKEEVGNWLIFFERGKKRGFWFHPWTRGGTFNEPLPQRYRERRGRTGPHSSREGKKEIWGKPYTEGEGEVLFYTVPRRRKKDSNLIHRRSKKEQGKGKRGSVGENVLPFLRRIKKKREGPVSFLGGKEKGGTVSLRLGR